MLIFAESGVDLVSILAVFPCYTCYVVSVNYKNSVHVYSHSKSNTKNNIGIVNHTNSEEAKLTVYLYIWISEPNPQLK
jgi:hypothetical protein